MKIPLLPLSFLFSITILTAQTEIYVSDAAGFNVGPWKILKFDEDGSDGEVFIDQNLGWPQDILFIEDQNVVLISNFTTGRITKHNAETGEFISNFAAGLAAPTRMKIGTDNLLYILQWSGSGKVKRYNLDGSFVDDFTSIGVPTSIGIDWDENGDMYISSFNGKYVQKFDSMGMDKGRFISTNLAGPTNIWFDDNGELLVLDYSGGAVKRFSSGGSFMSNFITNITNAEGVDFMANGNILIGSGGTSDVKMYTSGGNFISDIIPSGTLGLQTPNGVTLREKTVSIKEKVKDIQMFTPSIGSLFTMDFENIEGIHVLEIFSASGQLMDSLTVGEHVQWDASNLPEGVYYIRAKNKSSFALNQKIVVKH